LLWHVLWPSGSHFERSLACWKSLLSNCCWVWLAADYALQELVNLSAEEMASDEKRQQNANIRAEVAADLVRGQQQQASTDMFQ
jgi:hypothetical protein